MQHGQLAVTATTRKREEKFGLFSELLGLLAANMRKVSPPRLVIASIMTLPSDFDTINRKFNPMFYCVKT